MNQMYFKFLSLGILLSSLTAAANPTANYFRMWQGFKKPSLSSTEFLTAIPQFMNDTVSLYDGYGVLNNYIVIIPPKDKPAFIPDELALVGLHSEEIYREIRQTPEGAHYSNRHWDVFDKETSSSAKLFVNYQTEKPSSLVNNAAYDMVGEMIDWSKGHNVVYIGIRKDSGNFLANLQDHIELVSRHLQPQGLKGYIVIANENYEIAYMNWSSKEAYLNANFELVAKDASRFMQDLMYQEVVPFDGGSAIENTAYSTMFR